MTEIFAPFLSPKLKLLHARGHIDAAQRHIAEYAEQKPFNIYIHDRGSASPALEFGMVGYIPPLISLVIGDAVHCLRATLDLLAIDVVVFNRRSGNAVYFPIPATEYDLDKQIKDKNFHRASLEAIRLIKEIKPYRGGNEALRALHDLDNQDKHKVILPIFPHIEIEEMTIEFFSGASMKFENFTVGVDWMPHIEAIPKDIIVNGDMSLKIIFNSEAPPYFDAKPVLETLHSLADMVSGIIESFEKLLSGSLSDQPVLAPVVNPSVFGPRPRAMVYDRWKSPHRLADFNAAKRR